MTQTGNAPFLQRKKRGVSYFIATTHDKGEKGGQPFLNEGNLPSAQSPLSLKIENLQPKDAAVTHIRHYRGASAG